MTTTKTGSSISLTLDRWPVFFFYRDTVFGLGFVANVELTGRALCVREGSDEFNVIGVEPGGLAATGDTVESAHELFRKTYTSILFDIAAESRTEEDFHREVERFVLDKSAGAEVDWNEAVTEVRGQVQPDVPTMSASTPASFRITFSKDLAPQQNQLDEPRHLVAA